MDKLTKLWEDTLKNNYLGGPKIEVNQFLSSFGLMVGQQASVFKAAYLAYLKKENSYHYEPMIGAPLEFKYDFEKKVVTLKRFGDSENLTFEQFQRYMGLIDLIFSEVYPVGSVVELDESELSDEVKKYFKGNSTIGPLVTIHARRVQNDDKKSYIDYVGTVWPFGMLPDVEPIYLNNLLIKRVVAAGLSNQEEKDYVLRVLKKGNLLEGRLSTMYVN